MRARRMFSDDPPRILFTKDFHHFLHGDLLPGREVTIVYDAERLPSERSSVNGQRAWTLRCCFKFVEQGPVHSIDLWSETGAIRTKIGNEPGEGTMVIGRIQLPPDADHLTLWFLNTGASGVAYWDSNYGRNYVFRFTVDDVVMTSVGIEPQGDAPMSRFHVGISASAEVEDLAVLYRIMNDPAAAKGQDTRLPLQLGASPDPSGRYEWSASVTVPSGAVVRFALAYTAYGNPHTDSNNQRGYVTWAGAEPNREAGVV